MPTKFGLTGGWADSSPVAQQTRDIKLDVRRIRKISKWEGKGALWRVAGEDILALIA